jgi:DNA-nicking Smr family endonuclease
MSKQQAYKTGMGSRKTNKYPQEILKQNELDLHGYRVDEALGRMNTFLRTRGGQRIRIIVGKGIGSENGIAKIKNAVSDWLDGKGIVWSYSKIREGGDGAIEFMA